MARPREFDEHHVLERATEAFWGRGYEAVSMDDLTTATGLSRSSIYAAFGSKRGLFDAALEFYMNERVGMMLHDLESEDADLDTIRAFFGVLEGVATDYPDRFALGCFLTNTMTELGHSDDAIRRIGTGYVDRFRAAFANALRNHGLPEAEVTLGASLLAPLALGAFVIARGADTPMAETGAAVAALLDRWRA